MELSYVSWTKSRWKKDVCDWLIGSFDGWRVDCFFLTSRKPPRPPDQPHVQQALCRTYTERHVENSNNIVESLTTVTAGFSTGSVTQASPFSFGHVVDMLDVVSWMRLLVYLVCLRVCFLFSIAVFRTFASSSSFNPTTSSLSFPLRLPPVTALRRNRAGIRARPHVPKPQKTACLPRLLFRVHLSMVRLLVTTTAVADATNAAIFQTRATRYTIVLFGCWS